MRVTAISTSIEDLPVDFFADPDGLWEYDELAQLAGFDQGWGQLSVGALTEPFAGFPEGAAVVMFVTAEQCFVTLIDCLGSATVAA
jgi:hypothetical protein